MNGLAILNNERFLEKCERWFTMPCGHGAVAYSRLTPLPPLLADGWGFSQLGGSNPMGPSPNALKSQIIGALHAAAYLRMPLVRSGASGCLACLNITDSPDCDLAIRVQVVINILVIVVKLLFG